MIKDKQGNKYTFKQFLSKWKKGIEGITPFQQIKSQIKGTNVMLFGLLCGIVACAFSIKKLWWVEIILGAGFFNTYISLIGMKQKKKLLEQFSGEEIDVKSFLSNENIELKRRLNQNGNQR